MPRIEHVAGPSPYRHTTVGVSTVGDEHTVDDKAAAYLCDERGHFERVADEVVLDEDEYEIERNETDDEQLADATYDELYEIASERGVDGRSEMTKDELLDELRD